MDLTNDIDTPNPVETDNAVSDDVQATQATKALVSKILKTIKEDKAHHKKAFTRMRRDMFVAFHGRDETWSEANYKANIAGRHVKQKTSALYAKNPRATAKRRETMDFVLWDENPSSLEMAFQTIQQGMQAQVVASQQPPEVTEMGLPVPAQPQLPPGFDEANALIADFKQGMERRKQIKKIGKTLEILFAHALKEQKPLDFKMGAKALVRRTCTTGVGYIEIGFARERGPRPGLNEQLADARGRLAHLQRLTEEAVDGDIDQDDSEAAELQLSVQALTNEPEIILNEGLVFDFPQSTKVIPDKLCKSLIGFVGARHLAIEYLYTVDEIQEIFQVDLGRGYTGYGADGNSAEKPEQAEIPFDEELDQEPAATKGNGLVCVWKYYDKPSGLVYFVADGHPNFLREPAAPDVFVEDFWPVYALTFNAVESETELFPLSDVGLLLDMQNEHNRSRQGMREHREAARPRWGTSTGVLDDAGIEQLQKAKAFDVVVFNKDPAVKLSDALEAIPVPGVDPNLYGTDQFFSDIQIAVGAQEAQFGGVAKATATESAIAANSSASSDGSSSDDLDSFLTIIARSSGVIMLNEMSEEQVKKIAGVGAVWPEMTLADIAGELYLEVEAGSSGKPNQAVEIANWKEMLPFLLQLPGISPVWLARESVRRLDDNADLTEAISEGVLSVVAQNRNAQAGTGDPATDPTAQGGAGAANGPQPPGNTGSGPAMGSNQV